MTKHQEICWYKIKCAFFPTSCVHSTNIHPTNFLSNNFVLLTSLSEKYFIENTRAYPTRHSMIFSPDFYFCPCPLCIYDLYIQSQYPVLVFNA